VVETEEANNEGIEDRPDLGEGCIIHMAIVYVTPNLTKNYHITRIIFAQAWA
jgi:hypothetical protein